MKFCGTHWKQLRDAIGVRGLNHLVAPDGRAAFKRLSEAIGGEADASTWDPLASATWMIYGNAIQSGGMAVLSDNDDGSERCPVCYGMAQDPEVEEWIERAAEGCREYAVANDLVVTASTTLQ